MRMKMPGTLLATVLILAACDDGASKRKREQAEEAARAEAQAAAAMKASEERLRTTLRNITPGAKLRGVIAHKQALGGYAVCGQVNLTGAREDPYLPFVSVVSPSLDRIEQFVASSSAEAMRTYVETNTRCYEEGGPTSARSVVPLPPVPDTSNPGEERAESPRLPVPAPPGAAPAAPSTLAPSVGSAPSQGSVTTTSAHPVNLRNNPAGGGAVLRVVPRGTRLRVFSEAPGGWYQVGETEPVGWIHGSMLER